MDLREYREPYYDESGRLTTRPWPDERLGDILAAHLAGADCGSPAWERYPEPWPAVRP